MKKIAIITTVNHNVGDDFVREGLKFLFRKHFADQEISFSHIHKHSPITTRRGWEWFRNLKYSKRVDPLLPLSISKGRILEADLIVQSGAPVYWCHPEDGSHCADNEWYEPLIKRRASKNKSAKLVNLAAGSCQRYHSKGEPFCERCNDFITDFYQRSAVTTLRDHLAQKILGHINLNAPVMPCSSIFCKDELGIEDGGEEYVVVNYMKGGAHFTFGQKIEFEKWENEFKTFYFDLKKREKVIFSCHNQKEVDEALEIDPEANIFFKEHDYRAYVEFYSKAKYGIMNRVHGGFLMASFGKPSLIIGNDSRARMAEEVGLESIFVNDATSEILHKHSEFLSAGANDFKNRFAQIKSKALTDYMEALAGL